MANDIQMKRKRSRAFWRKNDLESIRLEPNRLVVFDENGQALLNLNPEFVARYRQLHNRLGREKGLPRKFGVTAALRGEGVTTVALSLAGVMAADLDAKILVVELNWWWPKLAELAGTAGRPGLAQLVAGASEEETLVCTSLPNLYLLPAGEIGSGEPTRLAHSQALRNTLKNLNERYDHLILDIPAVLATGDSLPLSAIPEQIGLVVRSGVTPSALVQRALDDIKHLPVSCVILNGEKISMPEWLYRMIPED